MKQIGTALVALGIMATASHGATIAWEAEDMTLTAGTSGASFQVGNETGDANKGDRAASGGQYISTASRGDNNSTARINLSVTEAGTYTLYIKAYAASSDQDSFYVPFQAEIGTTAATNGLNNFANQVNSASPAFDYRWANGSTAGMLTASESSSGSINLNFDGVGSPSQAQYALSVGSFDFYIKSREANLRIDGFVLSTDSDLTYSELEAALASAIPEPSSLALLGLGGLALTLRRRK